MNKLIITTILMTAMFASGALASIDPTYTGTATGTATVKCGKNLDCNQQSLILCTKNTTWNCDGRATATLTFGANWILTTTGPAPVATTNYALIYYYDTGPTSGGSKPWNGDQFGTVLATFAWPAAGTNLGPIPAILPNPADYNNNPNPGDNYCITDGYAHCSGAKLWIVPTTDLTGVNLPLLGYTPAHWLFETDMIRMPVPVAWNCINNQCIYSTTTCGISATNIAFGTINPGVPSAEKTSTVSNSGNAATTELDISGTGWTDLPASDTMPVGATGWNKVSGGPYTALTTSAVNTLTNVGASSSVPIYFQLTAPAAQALGSYSQTITFTGSC